jgi:hypothetical protein
MTTDCCDGVEVDTREGEQSMGVEYSSPRKRFCNLSASIIAFEVAILYCNDRRAVELELGGWQQRKSQK